MATFITWLFRTKLGNAVGIAALLLVSWYGFSKHYTNVGYTNCQSEHAAAVAAKNIEVIDGQNKRDKKTDAISDAAREAGSAATAKADATANETKEVIHYVYRDRIKTVPVAAGSCVHPLDAGVQDSIERAFDNAYGSGG